MNGREGNWSIRGMVSRRAIEGKVGYGGGDKEEAKTRGSKRKSSIGQEQGIWGQDGKKGKIGNLMGQMGEQGVS